MTDSVEPVRQQFQGKPKGWWPKDRHGQEIHVGDYLLFTDYRGYAQPAFGKVCRIGKTGKVHVEVVKVHPKDTSDQIEIKECGYTLKLSENMVRAIMLDKLASE